MLGGSLLLSACSSAPSNSGSGTSTPGAQSDASHQKRAVGEEVVAPGTQYSPGVLIGSSLYISGLQGADSQTHKLPADSDQEVKNCLDNVGQVLKDSGMGYDNVVSVQIFLVDISQFQQVTEIYKQYFKSLLPARTTVQVAKLSLGSRIEISAIAQK
jgi:2-iminobutanoate/2-iminopropanoate deaminase